MCMYRESEVKGKLLVHVNREHYFEDFLKVTLEYNFKTISKDSKFFRIHSCFMRNMGSFQWKARASRRTLGSATWVGREQFAQRRGSTGRTLFGRPPHASCPEQVASVLNPAEPRLTPAAAHWGDRVVLVPARTPAGPVSQVHDSQPQPVRGPLLGSNGCGCRQFTTWLSASSSIRCSAVCRSQMKMWPQSEPLITKLAPQKLASFI